jgi:hypothetical protein
VRLACRACTRVRWAPVLPGPHVLLILLGSAWSLLGGAPLGGPPACGGLGAGSDIPLRGAFRVVLLKSGLPHAVAHWSIRVDLGAGQGGMGVKGVGPGVPREGPESDASKIDGVGWYARTTG